MYGGWEEASSVVDLSQASGEHRTALLWASSFPELCAKGPQPLGLRAGCMVGWFRGRLLWTASQAVRGPARGDGLGAGPRGREDASVGGLQGGISAWSFGAGPTASSAARQLGTHDGLCSGWAMQEQQAGLAKDRLPVRGPSLRQVPGAQPPSEEARLQMLFLRVRPEIQAFLHLPPRWPS